MVRLVVRRLGKVVVADLLLWKPAGVAAVRGHSPERTAVLAVFLDHLAAASVIDDVRVAVCYRPAVQQVRTARLERPQLIPKLQEVSRRAEQEIPVERMFCMKATQASSKLTRCRLRSRGLLSRQNFEGLR
jgi:hypothetical protein